MARCCTASASISANWKCEASLGSSLCGMVGFRSGKPSELAASLSEATVYRKAITTS